MACSYYHRPFEDETFTRDMIGLDAGDVIKVGEIEVEIVRVDHDAYGAAALIIKLLDIILRIQGTYDFTDITPKIQSSFVKKQNIPTS